MEFKLQRREGVTIEDAVAMGIAAVAKQPPPRRYAIPDDAEIVGSFYDAGRNLFSVVLSSREFAPLVEGQDPPDLHSPTIETIDEPLIAGR